MTSTTHRNFGVEQEHFVFHKEGRPPTHSEIDLLWENLIRKDYQVQGTNQEGRVLSVQIATDFGPLVIANDSCTHLIETAFPKMNSLVAFRKLYEEVWNSLKKQFQLLGLEIRYGGCLPKAPAETYWRPKSTDSKGARLKKILHRRAIDDPLFCQDLPGCFAATHVSLEMPAEESIAKLPYFYSREYLVPRLFSTSNLFQGIRANCIRPLAWIANFHKPYPLLGIPEELPQSLEEYEQLQQKCSGRDYSFVSIRSSSRLEFRSACSQNSVEDVMRLVEFRLRTDLDADSSRNYKLDLSVKKFYEECSAKE